MILILNKWIHQGVYPFTIGLSVLQRIKKVFAKDIS